MKKIENQFIPNLLNELNYFQDQRPPNTATRIGFAEEDDVTELATRIKELAWKNLCSTAKTAIETTGTRFPSLVNEPVLEQLLCMISEDQFQSGKRSNSQRVLKHKTLYQSESDDIGPVRITETERYLFDLNGYIVVEGVLSKAEVKELNAVIDAVLSSWDSLSASSYIHTGLDKETLDMGNKDPAFGPVDSYAGLMLDWGEPIRQLVGHERILPYMIELVGPELRLDHQYAIFMRRDHVHRGKHLLHSGGTPYSPSQYYHFRDNKFYSGLTVASFCLTDVPPGAGGFCCIPGSHKSNLPFPKQYEALTPPPKCVLQIPMSAGDVLLFTEALTHGALAWEADHDRRALLFKYGPGHLQWEKHSPFVSRDYPWNDRQRRLLELPYVGNRPPVDD